MSRQRLVANAQKKTAPPHKIIAAGPLASIAVPRKNPKRAEASKVVRLAKVIEGNERGSTWSSGLESGLAKGTRPSRTAAATIAHVSVPLKGISVAAA